MVGSDSNRSPGAVLIRQRRGQRPLWSCQTSPMGQAKCQRAGPPQTPGTRKPTKCQRAGPPRPQEPENHEHPPRASPVTGPHVQHSPGPYTPHPRQVGRGPGILPCSPLVGLGSASPWASVSGAQEPPARVLPKAVGPRRRRHTPPANARPLG